MSAPAIPADWPFCSASRHVLCPPHLWHVQDLGQGPLLLLIHGAGASTHSFRRVIPLLVQDYRVIALDLPGQGFTRLGSNSRCSLDAMAQDIASLAAQEGWNPVAIIGHSAGAAISLRLADVLSTRSVIGINAALGRFEGVAGWIFPALARVLSLLPLVPHVFSKLAGTPRHVHQLLASTGSTIDASGEAQYLHLVRMPRHVSGTLAMMAQWQLDDLIDRLPRLTCPCLLMTGAQDQAVPAEVSQRAAARMPNARWTNIPGLGHLIHEEAPDIVVAQILEFLQLCEISEGSVR